METTIMGYIWGGFKVTVSNAAQGAEAEVLKVLGGRWQQCPVPCRIKVGNKCSQLEVSRIRGFPDTMQLLIRGTPKNGTPNFRKPVFRSS